MSNAILFFSTTFFFLFFFSFFVVVRDMRFSEAPFQLASHITVSPMSVNTSLLSVFFKKGVSLSISPSLSISSTPTITPLPSSSVSIPPSPSRVPTTLMENVNGVQVFHTVCVGGGSAVTVYNSQDDTSTSHVTSDFAGEHRFPLIFRRGPPPLSPIHSDVILSWFTCPGNLHHFLRETFQPLYETLLKVGYNSSSQSYLHYFRKPTVFFFQCFPGSFIYKIPSNQDDQKCYGSRYHELLELLPLEPNFDRNCIAWSPGVEQTPGSAPLQCFARAAVMQSGHPDVGPIAVKFLMSRIQCESISSQPRNIRILFLQRTNRVLLNLGELVEIAKQLTGVEVRVVKFEDITVAEQMKLSACYSDILVGVHGAGLQWGAFAGDSPHSYFNRGAILEISTPGWGPFYAEHLFAHHRATRCLCNEEAVPNPETFVLFSPAGTTLAGPFSDYVTKKFSDIRVQNLALFRSELQRLVDFVRVGGCAGGEADCGSNRQG